MDTKSSRYKLIAAGITLLLGIILAIGYPTGGVKANKITRIQTVQHKTNTVEQNTVQKEKPKKIITAKQTVVKKERPKKKRVIPVTPPPSNEGDDEEGC